MLTLRLAPIFGVIVALILQTSVQQAPKAGSASDCKFVISELRGDLLTESEDDDNEFLEIEVGTNSGGVVKLMYKALQTAVPN